MRDIKKTNTGKLTTKNDISTPFGACILLEKTDGGGAKRC